MKTEIIQTATGMSRAIKGIVATLGIVATSAAFAAEQFGEVSVPLAGLSFGSGKAIQAKSKNKDGPTFIFASPSYTYKISGSCMGEKGTALSKIIKDGTPIDKFVESISPGGSKFLKGTFPNPGGTLPVTLMSKTFKGTKNVPDIGTVKIAFTVVGRILATGECVMEITNVKLSSKPKQKLGTVKFKNGSKLSISCAPIVAILNPTKNINESNPVVTIQVTRQQNFKGAISVDYATVDGTADTINDYVETKGTLNFADGEKSKTIDVPLIDNEIDDGGRTFTLQLSNPSKGTFIGTHPSIEVNIGDND